MDITQFTQRYGRKAFTELLDIIFIHNWRLEEGGWRMYCIRHGIVTRNTKTVRIPVGKLTNAHYYTKDGVYGHWAEPIVWYRTLLRNGSNKIIFDLTFKQEDLEEWKLTQSTPHQ